MAIKCIKNSSKQEYAPAKSSLGSMYYNGQGVQQDYMQALQWFKKAAQQGYDIAQINLGSMYAHGQGVQQDYMQALQWFKKAAEQGYAPRSEEHTSELQSR